MPSISNLPGLSSKTKDKLALAGYMNTEELSCVKPLHLSYGKSRVSHFSWMFICFRARCFYGRRKYNAK